MIVSHRPFIRIIPWLSLIKHTYIFIWIFYLHVGDFHLVKPYWTCSQKHRKFNMQILNFSFSKLSQLLEMGIPIKILRGVCWVFFRSFFLKCLIFQNFYFTYLFLKPGTLDLHHPRLFVLLLFLRHKLCDRGMSKRGRGSSKYFDCAKVIGY